MNFIRGELKPSMLDIGQPFFDGLKLYIGNNIYKLTINYRFASLRIITGEAREDIHPSARVNLDALARYQ